MEEDDRVRINDDFDAYVNAICGSDFEGCFCTRPKRHDDLHRCGNAGDECPRWSDRDAERWHEHLREEMKNYQRETPNEERE